MWRDEPVKLWHVVYAFIVCPTVLYGLFLVWQERADDYIDMPLMYLIQRITGVIAVLLFIVLPFGILSEYLKQRKGN